MGKTACDQCKGPLGDKYYSDVPGQGNLCLTCHQDWHRAKMAIGDYEALEAPIYHWEEIKTAAEIGAAATLEVNSIGRCSLCGYEGPGPKHDCASEGSRIHNTLARQKELIESATYQERAVGQALSGMILDTLKTPSIADARIQGVPGPPPKDEDQVTKSQVEAIIAEDLKAEEEANGPDGHVHRPMDEPIEQMIEDDAAPPSRPGTIDEWMDSTNLSDIHRDIAIAMASRLERCEEALNHILEEVDRLDCAGGISVDERRECLDMDGVLAEDFCARCSIVHWTKKGLGHGP